MLLIIEQLVSWSNNRKWESVHRFGQFIKSSPLMHIKEESDGGYHSHSYSCGMIEKYRGGGHLNFNNMSDVLNLRIKIPDETFSYNLI